MAAKKSSESMNFEETLKYIEDNKLSTIQNLITFSFKKLYERKEYYNDWAKRAEESGFSESAALNYLHSRIVGEAIVIKKLMSKQL